jgi:hypothetical protein
VIEQKADSNRDQHDADHLCGIVEPPPHVQEEAKFDHRLD